MRAMAQSVAAERDAATSHILTLQRELEARAVAIASLKSQAEEGLREVRSGGILRLGGDFPGASDHV